MKKTAIILTFGLMAIAACDKNAPQEAGKDNKPFEEVTVEAGIDADTKVSVSGTAPVWTAGDKISMFTSDGTQCALTADKGGSTTTTFSGMKPTGSTLTTAFYPYSADYSQSKSGFSLTLPQKQDGTAANAMMMGTGSQESGYSFTNINCVIRMNVPSSLAVTKVELIRDDPVTGKFSLTASGSGYSISSPSSISDSDRSAVATSSKAFSGHVYIATLPSSGKGYTLIFTNTSGKVAVKSGTFAKAYTAGTIKDLGTVSGLTFGDVASVSGSASSQLTGTLKRKTEPQIKNGDFETWTFDGDNLPNNWNSFQTADGTWAGTAYSKSNRQVAKSTDTRPGSSGGSSCRIWARAVLGVVAQGNITTGRVHAGSTSADNKNNYNYSDRDGSNTNNGVKNPCAMQFTGMPDSIVVWAKFKPAGTLSSYPNAKFSAIIHDDHDYISYGLSSNDNNTNKGYVVACAVKMIEKNNAAWQRISLPFEYTSNKSAKYIQINASTNSYPGKGTSGDELYLDDIEVIYNHMTLTIGSTGWAPMCLDFNALVPSGATAYYATGMSGGYVTLVAIPAGSVIPKGTGVIVKGSGSVIFEGSTNTPASVSGNILVGALSETAAPSGCYVLSSASTSSMAVFGKYSGSRIAAGSVYIKP